MSKFLCRCMCSFLLGVYLQGELLDHMVTMVNLEGIARLFSKAEAPSYISTCMKSSVLTMNKVIHSSLCHLFAHTHKIHTT